MRFLTLFLILISLYHEANSKPLNPNKLNKEGLFKTKRQVLYNEIDLRRNVDLRDFNKLLVIRHKEVIMKGPATYCGGIEDRYLTSFKEGRFSKNKVDPFMLEMFKNSRGFDKVYPFEALQAELGHEDTESRIQEKYGDYLIADVGVYWEGCSRYRFELKIVLPSPKEDIPLLFITKSANGWRSLDRKMFYPVFNSYKDWLIRGFSGNLLLHPHELISIIPSIEIDGQIWADRNLNVSKFINGDAIFYAKNEDEWQKAIEQKIPAYCYFLNNPMHGHRFGKLYNYYAITDPRGIAPDGWAVPSYEDWNLLFGNLFPEELIFARDEFMETPSNDLLSEEFLNQLEVDMLKQVDEILAFTAKVDEIKAEIDSLINSGAKEIEWMRKHDEFMDLLNQEISKYQPLLDSLNNEPKETFVTRDLDDLEFKLFREPKLLIGLARRYRANQYWGEFYPEANNISGFSALPGGKLHNIGMSFFDENENLFPDIAAWWYIHPEKKSAGYAEITSRGMRIQQLFEFWDKNLKQNTLTGYLAGGYSVRLIKRRE